MRSTGEVMGIDSSPGLAFVKSQLAAGTTLPEPDAGAVFLSLADRDKETGIDAARHLGQLGYRFVATAGTAKALDEAGILVDRIVARLGGDGPDAVALMEAGEITLVINTPRGRGARADGDYIRTAAALHGIPLLTTTSAAIAAALGLAESRAKPLEVCSLQARHEAIT